jgi:hypothetical protein
VKKQSPLSSVFALRMATDNRLTRSIFAFVPDNLLFDNNGFRVERQLQNHDGQLSCHVTL